MRELAKINHPTYDESELDLMEAAIKIRNKKSPTFLQGLVLLVVPKGVKSNYFGEDLIKLNSQK